jgi:TetR/AcrR family transcriptional repressor of mexCD-oprJ operon
MHPPAAGHRRADANRNRDAIIDATVATLAARPQASVGEIAAAAGLSRGTIYGHFSSRRQLVFAAFRAITARVDDRLARIDPALPIDQSIDDLVSTSWLVLGHFAGMAAAARSGASPNDLLVMYEEPRARIEELLIRGRQAGVFRSDQNVAWQAACFSAIVHAGATRMSGGQPASGTAEEMVAAIRAMLAAEPAASASGSPEPPAPTIGRP